MKRFLLALALFCTALTVSNAEQKKELVVRVDINIVEMAEKDVKDYGIEQSVLYDLLLKSFAAASIIVKDNPNLPEFVLQIKSLPSDNSIATLVQGNYYEAATLASNKKPVWAITWSQSDIVTGSKKNYAANVQGEVKNIASSFILDYQQRTASQLKNLED